MLDKPLQDVKRFKDLGVTISKDLSRDNHISITVHKANNQLELIKRSVSTTNVKHKIIWTGFSAVYQTGKCGYLKTSDVLQTCMSISFYWFFLVLYLTALRLHNFLNIPLIFLPPQWQLGMFQHLINDHSSIPSCPFFIVTGQ